MILTLAAKELKSLFASPLAWIILGALQGVLAWIFLLRLDAFLELQPQLATAPNAPGATEVVTAPLFSAAALVLMFMTPLLSMRLIAEERRSGTMALLMSAPISMTAIVLGKFLGLTAILLLPVAMVSAMGLALAAGAAIDPGLIACNALGLTLLVMTFAAVGLLASSLTSQPGVAALLAWAALLGSWLAGLANPESAQALRMLSITGRFESFNAGVLDSAEVAWHVITIGSLLALAIRRLDRDRLVGRAA